MGKKKKVIGYRQIFLIICIAFWVVYPFFTRLVVNKVPDAEAKYFSTTNGYIIDLVLYCKELALLVFAGIAVLYFLGERVFPDKVDHLNMKRAKRLKYPLIFTGVYIIFTVLSFLFSNYKSTALWGVHSEYEGFLAVLGYSVIFLIFMYYMKPSDEKDKMINGIVILKYGIAILSILIGLLSIVEVFYKPILEIPFVQDLISSEANRDVARSIKNENFIGQICLTFNNPGFLGGFCALFIPVNFVISLEAKKVWKVIGIAGTSLMGLPLVWSSSKVAFVSVIITLPLCIFFLVKRCNNKGQIRKLIIQIMITLSAAIFIIAASKLLPTYSSRVRPEGIPEYSSNEPVFKLTKVEINDGELYLYSKDVNLQVRVDKDILEKLYFEENPDFSKCLVFSDGQNVISGRKPTVLKATNIRKETDGFKLDDERFKAVSVSVENQLMIMDLGYSGTIEFFISQDGIKAFGQGSTLIDEIPQPAVTGFENFYSFATGRGYIWVQSLPILKNSLLIGGGNGTFAFRFIQNEMAGLMNTHGSYKYVIDRPHNWYLRMALSSGVPALIAVISLFIWYIIKFFKAFMKKETDPAGVFDNMDIGLFAGIIAFLLCGFINDSCITVNPLFWVLFGTAVARRA